MLENYVNHFTDGKIESHKKGSINWINNKNPSIETYIGFIEN